MLENKTKEINQRLTKENILTNQEYPCDQLLSQLTSFQKVMIEVVSGVTYVKVHDMQDMMKRLEELANRYGYEEFNRLYELKEEICKLCTQVARLKSKMQEESFAQVALKQKGRMKIIYSNISLEPKKQFVESNSKGMVIVGGRCKSRIEEVLTDALTEKEMSAVEFDVEKIRSILAELLAVIEAAAQREKLLESFEKNMAKAFERELEIGAAYAECNPPKPKENEVKRVKNYLLQLYRFCISNTRKFEY